MSDDVPSSRSQRLRELKGRRLLLVITAVIIASLVATGFVWAPRKVSIHVDNQVLEVKTHKTYVEQVLSQAAIALGPDDAVYPGLKAKVKHGMKIQVVRAVPVTVSYDGKTVTVMTAKPTVGDVLKTGGFPLGEKDKVVPDQTTPVNAGMDIHIIRVTETVTTREMPIVYPVERRGDESLEMGVVRVVQTGRDGVKNQKIKVRYENGQEVGSEVLEETVVVPPVPEIVLVGTRTTVQTSRGNVRFKKVFTMEATAYLPTDGSPEGLTAMGIPARRGVVAVDPDVIPLGTKVYVPGYGFALAADVGGAIVGHRIDLCIEDHDEAWNFGRRMVKVYVLE